MVHAPHDVLVLLIFILPGRTNRSTISLKLATNWVGYAPKQSIDSLLHGTPILQVRDYEVRFRCRGQSKSEEMYREAKVDLRFVQYG